MMMHLLAALFFVQNTILGGFFARMDGGGGPKTPEIVERFLCMTYFVLGCLPFAGVYALAAYIGVVGIATGHGQYFLARTLKAIKPERFDFIVAWVFGADWRVQFEKDHVFSQVEIDRYFTVIRQALYRRCVFGMFVTGTLIGLPAAILSLVFGQWIGLLFLLTGVVKAAAYVFGYEVFRSTLIAEWVNGMLRTAICLAVLFVCL